MLAAHGVRGKNTSDYVKLADVLKLREYAIRLPFYPWLDLIRPFAGWSPSPTPTKDLGWYNSYQAVKHDRENHFNRATLLNALQAVCGCAVMLFAQFGKTGFHYRSEINSFFELEKAPVWHPAETYPPRKREWDTSRLRIHFRPWGGRARCRDFRGVTC